MAIPLFSEIERLIVEHGSASVLKEHVSLLRQKLALLEAEFLKLEKENSQLKRRVEELSEKLSFAVTAQEFHEERGALFKRKPGGGWHIAVYCPRCKSSASPFPPGAEFNCQCGWFSSFTENELSKVMAGLPQA